MWTRRPRKRRRTRLLDQTNKSDTKVAGKRYDGGATEAQFSLGPLNDDPATKALAERALSQLFDQLGLTLVPAQVLRILDEERYPSAALAAFVHAIGCDTRLVRQRDPHEIERVQTIIDLLTQSGELLSALDADERAELERLLYRGDFDEVRKIAELLAELQRVLDGKRHVSGGPELAAYRKHLDKAATYAKHPTKADHAEIHDAIRAVDVLGHSFKRLNASHARFLLEEQERWQWWPPDWDETSAEGASLLDATTVIENVLAALAATPFTADEVDERLELIEAELETLDELRKKATGRAKRPAQQASAVDQALNFFDFSAGSHPTCDEIKLAWRRCAKANHTDLIREPEAQALAKVRMQDANHHRDVLRKHFGCR